ncbi:hypothetical protein [Pseudomonas protegens]
MNWTTYTFKQRIVAPPPNPGAVFSLRYRPWGKPLLDHQLTSKARDVQNP